MKRGSVILTLAFTFLVGTVWYFGAFRPIDTARATAVRRETAARREQVALTATLTRLEALESDRANQEALERRLDGAVPRNPDLGVFIVEANSIAGAAGLSWIAITPSSTTTEVASGFTAIPMEMRVEGGFFPILDYLNRLELAKRLVIIDSVTVTPLNPDRTGGVVDTTNPQLTATMRARIFTRADAFTANGALVTTTTTAPPPTTTAKKEGA